MLPYKNRLIKKTDFERVYKYGKFFCFENICLKAVKNRLTESRVGFSVGLSFSKKATERNRKKRQLRGFFMKNWGRIKKGLDMVVIFKKDNNKTAKIEEKIEKILSKANLFIDN